MRRSVVRPNKIRASLSDAARFISESTTLFPTLWKRTPKPVHRTLSEIGLAVDECKSRALESVQAATKSFEKIDDLIYESGTIALCIVM
jgi:hypothetical protein